MANSLMELYGGGMMGPSNNYQLGGAIARSRRGREYQGEMRRLKEESERMAKRQRRASGLGSILSTVGSIAGSFIPIPGVGTAIGSAIGTAAGSALGRFAGESTYKDTKVGGGKYAQESRKDLRGYSEDFKRSRGERALVGGLKAGAMKFASTGGADYLKAKFDPQFAKLPHSDISATQLADMTKLEQITGGGGWQEKALQELAEESPGLGREGFMKSVLKGRADAFVDPSSYTPFEDMPLSDIPATQLGDFSNIGLPPQYPSDAYYGPYLPNRQGGGLINYMAPMMQGGGRVGTEYDPNRPQQQQQQQTNPYGQQMFGSNNPVFGPGTDWSGLPISGVQGGGAGGFGGAGGAGGGGGAGGAQTPYGRGINTAYGTATDTMGALKQMGMENIASDPRLQEYLKDLPQFGMGYAQQVGDIYTGGKQAAGSIRGGARTAVGQRGFGRSGIGSQQLESAVTGLTTDIDRQRRGVVEGYQADVLGAIGDIEQKAGFTFGQGTGGQTQDEVRMDDLMSQGYSEADARRMIYEDAQAGPSFG